MQTIWNHSCVRWHIWVFRDHAIAIYSFKSCTVYVHGMIRQKIKTRPSISRVESVHMVCGINIIQWRDGYWLLAEDIDSTDLVCNECLGTLFDGLIWFSSYDHCFILGEHRNPVYTISICHLSFLVQGQLLACLVQGILGRRASSARWMHPLSWIQKHSLFSDTTPESKIRSDCCCETEKVLTCWAIREFNPLFFVDVDNSGAFTMCYSWQMPIEVAWCSAK